MINGINLMSNRLAQGIPHASLAHLSERATELRHLAGRSNNLNPQQQVMLLNAAQEIEWLIALVALDVVQENDGGMSDENQILDSK